METRRSQRQKMLSSLVQSNTQKTISSLNPTANKRKNSETLPNELTKRSAFGDITNRKTVTTKPSVKKARTRSGRDGSKSETLTESDISSLASQEISTVLSSQESLKLQSSQDVNINVNALNEKNACVKSVDLEEPSAAESGDKISTAESSASASSRLIQLSIPRPESEENLEVLNFYDVDKANANDVFQSPAYAQDFFNYYKSRETEFLVDDYMARQSEVTPAMRSVLVDWLVELQENFELNHETLYLAVRLVDRYLMRRNVTKEALQLVGAAAMFIGCKFDERIPPLVDDFLYICDDAYNRAEFVRMERDILSAVDFNLGMPISYRFLRRYAKAGKKAMPLLTLARYINETALMSYRLVTYKESLIAAGCLRLAMKMSEPSAVWDDTLIYYSGYRDADLKDIVRLLNNLLHTRNVNLQTVQNKYSHPVFFKVATKPLIATGDLYPETSASSTAAVYV